MGGLHVFVVRHASVRLSLQRNPAFRAETEFGRPVENWTNAGLDPDLVKPGVARFGQRLDKVERAAVGFFPVMKGRVADIHRGHAFVLVLGRDRVALKGGQANGDLEGGSRRIRGTISARKERDVGISPATP